MLTWRSGGSICGYVCLAGLGSDQPVRDIVGYSGKSVVQCIHTVWSLLSKSGRPDCEELQLTIVKVVQSHAKGIVIIGPPTVVVDCGLDAVQDTIIITADL